MGVAFHTAVFLATISATAVLGGGRSSTGAKLEMLTDEHARCLDGSQGGYYLQEGSSFSTTVIILLEGGGVCSHEEDCLARAKSQLGSSKGYAPEVGLDALGEFMSNDCNTNPDFCTAWKVFLPYCGGDLHAGTRIEATNDTWGLYMSGHLIVKAMIEQLKAQHSLGSASTLIFSGQSAGGVGVFNNVDYVQSVLPGVNVVGMPIGGYIPIVTPYDGPSHQNEPELASAASWQRFPHLQHTFADQSCVQALGAGEAWKCGVPTLVYEHIAAPLLVVESQIDSVIMFQFSDAPSKDIPAVEQWITSYRANATYFADVVLSSSKDALFSPACFMHCEFKSQSPLINGTGYLETLGNFVLKGSKPKLIDTCSGLQCGTSCPNSLL